VAVADIDTQAMQAEAAVAALDTMEMIVDHMQAEQQLNQEVQAVVLVTQVVDILPAK
jgi:hypothetical protein